MKMTTTMTKMMKMIQTTMKTPTRKTQRVAVVKRRRKR
jgi:hypothetical protein